MAVGGLIDGFGQSSDMTEFSFGELPLAGARRCDCSWTWTRVGAGRPLRMLLW